MCEEFKFSVLPSNQHVTTNFISSSEFIIIGIHADIALVTVSDEYDGDLEYTSDIDYTTQERFLYSKDLKLDREELLRNEKASRTALVNSLTRMEVPERYQNEIIDEVLCFVKDERFSRCDAVAVDIEIVRYVDDDDEGEDGDEMDDVIEPSFRMVAVDEKMRAENENCVICMDGYSVGSEVCKLKCHHVYHRKCLLEWLDKSDVTCPICWRQPPNFCVAPEPPPTRS